MECHYCRTLHDRRRRPTARNLDRAKVVRLRLVGVLEVDDELFRAEPLPLSGAMKVLKRELRDPYWAGHERRVN